MSGHSKWATIHRAKEVTDAKRGLLFSKLSRAITLAARGNPNPDANFKLRIAIDKARASNMPKDNIGRAISRASGGEDVTEVTYEGFGPGGIGVIVEAVTDNKNRTAQEMKSLFDRGGGSLGGPGSVSFNFEQTGYLLVEKKAGESSEEQMLALIDAGANDVEESEDGIEVYAVPAVLSQIKTKIEEAGFVVREMSLVMRPKILVRVDTPELVRKTLAFLESIGSHDDVQEVFTNADIPDEIAGQA